MLCVVCRDLGLMGKTNDSAHLLKHFNITEKGVSVFSENSASQAQLGVVSNPSTETNAFGGQFSSRREDKLGCRAVVWSSSPKHQQPKTVVPQTRQRSWAGLHQVKMGLKEYKMAAVTLEFGLGNLEWIAVETGSVSFCLLFPGDFLFHLKSGNGHC